jgi:hypothetical protein
MSSNLLFTVVPLFALLAPNWLAGQLIEDFEAGVGLGAVASEIQPPISDQVTPLLEVMCPGRAARSVYFQQLGCQSQDAEPGNSTWRPPLGVNGLLYGHFLSPTSDDVILSGNRLETHPLNWGGTLLMTKQEGAWKPVWYRGGIITRHCMTVATSSGRQILVCESGLGGMGHTAHVLYSIDLRPDRPVQEALIVTDSYVWPEQQTQSVKEVKVLSMPNGTRLQVRVSHARYECHKERLECGDEDFVAAEPAPGDYTLDFELQDSRFVLTPASDALFRQLFPEVAKYLPEGLISHGEPPLPR